MQEETEETQRTATFWTAVEDARKALARYYHVTELLAERGVADPPNADEAREELRSVHTATISAFLKLRPYIKEELEDYWDGAEETYLRVESVPGLYFWGDFVALEQIPKWLSRHWGPDWPEETPRQYVIQRPRYHGLYLLDHNRTPYRTYETETRVRQQGMVRERATEPELFPPEIYNRAVDLLGSALFELGFSPKPDKRVPRTEITEEDVELWRQRNKEMGIELPGES